MRFSTVLLVGLGVWTAGCTQKVVDTDGDGISDEDEATYGTDPENADSDSDGLKDGDELDFGSDPIVADADADGLLDAGERDAGTDPNAADSDGDGYRDGDEVVEGSDPADGMSLIYAGHWPYNPNKAAMVDPGFEDRANVGTTLANFKWLDQYGQAVDIYDFAQQGKPVVLDISTVWCGWCRVMAAWIGGDLSEAQTEIDHGYDLEGAFGRESWWDLIPDLVSSGQVYWVTAITQDVTGGPPVQQDVVDWSETFVNPNVPVILDEEAALESYLRVSGFPTVFLLDENLVFTVYERRDYTAVFTQLEADFGG